MSSNASAAGRGEPPAWTPARVYCAISGPFHVVLAIGGFVINQAFPTSVAAARAADSAHVFGIFETNGWHTLGAAAVAVAALYGVLNPNRAREIALAIGALHVPLFLSLLFWEPETFLIASNAADQVVHAASAIFGIGTGLATRKEPGRRSRVTPAT